MSTITAARVIVTCPGRNYVTLKVETSDGAYGIGDATLNGRELAVASYLADHVAPLLIGRDPADIEDIWQSFYRGAYWRRGPVTMTSIAAVDVALWDLKGKALGTPVWNLLGGRSRTGVLTYSHASGRSIEDTVEQVQGLVQAGYKAVRIQCAVPGIDEMYGVPRAEAGRDGPDLPYLEAGWASEKYVRHVPRLFAAVRDAVGEDVHLLHDAHHRLTPIEAAGLGKRLEEYQPFWLEDPVQAELQEGFRVIRSHTTTPLAVGEVFNSVFDCELLIREQLIDFIRMSVVHGGGITALRKVAALAEPYHVRFGCHGAGDLSPVTMAAAAHFGLAVHNVAIQEHGDHSDATHEVFPHSWRVQDGYLHPGDAPGLGVDIDEDAAGRHPYRRAYLPVSRKVDGTAANY
jgi:mannonate dehydratase